MSDYKKLINSPIQYVKGVGEKRTALFNKLGIYNVEDLIHYFPREYEDRRHIYNISQLSDGMVCCIKAPVLTVAAERRFKYNLAVYSLAIDDGTGSINVFWFSSPKYKRKFERGVEYIFYGKAVSRNGWLQFELIEAEAADKNTKTGKILPVYPLTKGINQTNLRSMIASVMDGIDFFEDFLPQEIVRKNNLMSYDKAMRCIHFPDDMDDFEKARRRFVFEELFVLQLSLNYMKDRRCRADGLIFTDISCGRAFVDSLPFELTGAQKRAIREICDDFKSGTPMNRLVQGDVGSGKTVVAACAMYITVCNGYQAALMAPTEILANQHYNTFKNLFGDTFKIALLTGSVSGKKKLLADIEAGEYDIVIGTHAIIEDNVNFKNLGFCVTDEQHRFGVSQRSKLSSKSQFCHVLVMSATPIPRTLALILYGDLDITIIDDKPAGRQDIDTFCVNDSIRGRAYNFVRKQLAEGRQAYVVCPLVEESESLDAVSSVQFAEKLQTQVFPEYKVGLLHGKMKAKEKDEVMMRFKDGEVNLLVATTVIEVGVDVPNANIMVIENAERFGLSQLHQLRGRVGRGDFKSYCVLITNSQNDATQQRMQTMTSTNDGFKISQKDLELRGCGEFFGTRQHGLPELKIANLFTDIDILKDAQMQCEELLTNNPHLYGPDCERLKERITHMFDKFDGADIFN
ncbi:MAG: ATP-dependent DNA helicase RecG [Clostridia bacterium]|nr:ATP-dependent DNA helicase RecG [Clostridia bacterium]